MINGGGSDQNTHSAPDRASKRVAMMFVISTEDWQTWERAGAKSLGPAIWVLLVIAESQYMYRVATMISVVVRIRRCLYHCIAKYRRALCEASFTHVVEAQTWATPEGHVIRLRSPQPRRLSVAALYSLAKLGIT